MRKITCDAMNAFVANKPFSRNNTQIRQIIKDGPWYFLLHGSSLGYEENGKVFVHFQKPEHHTKTTCDRLNGLLRHPNVNLGKYKRFYRKNGVIFLRMLVDKKKNPFYVNLNMTLMGIPGFYIS